MAIHQQETLMKPSRMIALASIVISMAAAADQGAVQFEVVLMRDGKVVTSPKVVAHFGQTAALAQIRVMKFEGSASAPDAEGNSLTAVKLYLFENGEMRPPQEMSMLANLTKTPSFEYSVPGTNARFVVMPRLVKLPESEG
jgi:hypothetical protein